MNMGASLLGSDDERVALARMDLAAGRRARSAAAFEAAFRYLDAGTSVLDGWERDGGLALELHTDTQVASLLIRTADALRLLGARSVLTGITPRVAQTLVAMNVDLGRMVTKQTLQSGIAYAMGSSAAA